ncbi:MAG: hypothetical protein K8Q99_05050 [Acholeplasmataceae bacterium]|nr:hypothetical protein [Acholeplasmataceae bacterium]
MDGYKKIFKSKKTRDRILKILFFIPNKLMLKIQYKIKLKRFPNFSHPKRFTEKIQLYKINYKNDILKKCIDKYAVREYVKSKNLDYILNKNYGVYDNFKNIDFSRLPKKFVIKTTNGGGGLNILICKDKEAIDYVAYEKAISDWSKVLKSRDGGREWAYSNLKPRIIIEEYLENSINPDSGISDYKFFCFNGIPKYVVVDSNRYIKHVRNFYDSEWNYLNISSDHENMGDILDKPKNYEQMINIAKKLSSDFPFVRVDLYNLNGVIRFGELTFYPWSGYVQFFPDDFDILLGNEFTFY